MVSFADGGSPPSYLLRQGEAATLLGVEPRTLEAWRCRGGGPPFVQVSSRAIRYRQADLVRWIEDRVRRSTSEYPEALKAA
jgi:DNA-binding transcriptional MerR regulator